MPGDAQWVAAVAGAVAAVAAVATAIVAGWAFLLARRELPGLRWRLAGQEFIASELAELIRAGANAPDKSVMVVRERADAVLLRDVRVGRHDPVFDRIAFEFVGGLPGYKIVPLGADELAARDVQGVWGLSVRLEPCRLRYREGPHAGELSLAATSGSPLFPSLTDYRLVAEGDPECEWAIGLPSRTAYLVVELSDPPRLAIDFFREFSATATTVRA